MDCSVNIQMSTEVSHDTKSVPELLSNFSLSDIEVFAAMRAGNKEIMEKVKIQRCRTPMASLKNDKGDSILHVAASYGHLELVKNIVTECPSLLLEKNGDDCIPLHVAARASRLQVVMFLATSMACLPEDGQRLDPYAAKDKNGDTPLHLAMLDLEEKTELLKKQHIRSQGEFMVFVCMSLRCRSLSKYISRKLKRLMETASWLVDTNRGVSFLANNFGISPLYLAVKAGNLSLVNDMLSRPANSVQGKYSNLTSLLKGRKSLVHVALEAKNIDILDVILNEEPNLVNERDEQGQTCIAVGASVGFSEGIHKVLELSSLGVFECDKDESFPIHKAVEKSHLEVVREILERCPDSIELLNKQGQNVIHIAAKSGKALPFLKKYIINLGKKHLMEHLMEEKDVDGNTPLHLATLKWRARTARGLMSTKTLDIQNKEGLRPLDIAQIKLKSDYVFQERMTMMVLLCAYKPRGVYWIPTSGMTLISRSYKKVDDENFKDQEYEKFKDRVNVLLLMAALIATMTFAAGFTMPGGFNSSAPNMGSAILIDNQTLTYFLVCDTLAMQFSLVAIVALVWAQLGDQELAHKAFHLALPSLFFALCCMSFAFQFGVGATIGINKSLTKKIGYITGILTAVVASLLSPYVIPQLHGIPFLEYFTRTYLDQLLLFVDEGDSEKLYTDLGHRPGFLKRVILEIKDRLPCFN